MIPTNPPPTFRKPELWSDDFTDFVKKCLVKNPEQRATATQLLQVSKVVVKHKCVCCQSAQCLISGRFCFVFVYYESFLNGFKRLCKFTKVLSLLTYTEI